MVGPSILAVVWVCDWILVEADLASGLHCLLLRRKAGFLLCLVSPLHLVVDYSCNSWYSTVYHSDERLAVEWKGVERCLRFSLKHLLLYFDYALDYRLSRKLETQVSLH